MIPVLTVCGKNLPDVWEQSLIALYEKGIYVATQYGQSSLDSTMLMVVEEPLSEPRIHMDMPGGVEDLQEYVMELCDGIKDHWVRNLLDPVDKRWEYTYHGRIADQLEICYEQLCSCPHTRRAQAITWIPELDQHCYDPPCLQSLWFRIVDDYLCMDVRFRSRDAYRAAFMNAYALIELQSRMAKRLGVGMGRYMDMSDSYHIYDRNMDEFEDRFMQAYHGRAFEKRTMRFEDVSCLMDEAVPGILEKVRQYDEQHMEKVV